jgi:hypothetical protein
MNLESEQKTAGDDIQQWTARVLAAPKAERARIRKQLAQTETVIETVSRAVATQPEHLGEILKLGDEIVYRALLIAWPVTEPHKQDQIIRELRRSATEQYRRIASALAMGLVRTNFDHAVALIESVNPIMPLPEFARSEFTLNAREILRKLENTDLAEFRQRKLITLIITSLRGKDEKHVAIAVDAVNRVTASHIDPGSFQSNGRKEWQTFLEDLSSDNRARLAAALEPAPEEYRSLFWDQRFGALRSTERDGAEQTLNEATPTRTVSKSQTDSSGPESLSVMAAESSTPMPASPAGAVPSQTLQDEALNWLGRTQMLVNSLMTRLRAGDAALAEIERLRRELSDREDEINRLSADLEAAKLHLDEIEKERARLRDEDDRLTVEIRNLRAHANALREESDRKDRRLAEMESAKQSFERQLLELEESRILYGEQRVGELKRALAERISREVEDMPDLADSSVQAAPELLRIRFRSEPSPRYRTCTARQKRGLRSVVG